VVGSARDKLGNWELCSASTAAKRERTLQLGPQLIDVARCPHCSVARPLLDRKWQSGKPIPRGDGEWESIWAGFACSSCGSIVTAKGEPGDNAVNAPIAALFPEPRQAHADLPLRARVYLQQAYETLNAPDAAAMIAGSAVDAMLKALGYKEGSLYGRIGEAVKDNVLTQGMADWAHEVRLGSNNPRHADDDDPHVSRQQAVQAVEFAEALGQFLFVLTAKIKRGIEAAKRAGAEE
jgi:hypothetical protein